MVRVPVLTDMEHLSRVLGMTATLEFFDTTDFGIVYADQSEALAAAKVSSPKDLPVGTELIYWPATADAHAARDGSCCLGAKPALTGAMLSAAQVGYGEGDVPNSTSFGRRARGLRGPL